MKKKLLELTMTASDENALKLDNPLDKEDSFNTLFNEKSKKSTRKNK